MKKKALVPIANGTEEIEAVCVIDVLRRADTQVTVASVQGRQITAARGTATGTTAGTVIAAAVGTAAGTAAALAAGTAVTAAIAAAARATTGAAARCMRRLAQRHQYGRHIRSGGNQPQL